MSGMSQPDRGHDSNGASFTLVEFFIEWLLPLVGTVISVTIAVICGASKPTIALVGLCGAFGFPLLVVAAIMLIGTVHTWFQRTDSRDEC
jgi:hypothetical protein